MSGPFLPIELHRDDCLCSWCENARDPTGRIGRGLAIAICLVLIAAGLISRI